MKDYVVQDQPPIHCGWVWHIQPNNTIRFFYTGGSSIASTGTIINDGWHHIAVVRSGVTITHFIDGTQSGSGTVSNGSLTSYTNLILGDEDAGFNTQLSAYMDEFCLTNLAKYTSNFTPPTSPFSLVTTESDVKSILFFEGANNGTVFYDQKGHNYTRYGSSITSTTQKQGGLTSAYIGNVNLGNGIKCSEISSSDFILTGDFTIECWIYQTAITDDFGLATIISKCDTSGRTNSSLTSFELSLFNSTPIVNTFVTDSGSYSITGAISISLNSWNHIALTRSGNTLYLIVNRFISGSVSINGNGIVNTTPLIIGATYDSIATNNCKHSLRGYIDNFRVENGEARYTSANTPTYFSSQFPYNLTNPSSPLPYGSNDSNWSNVGLFINFDELNYFKDENGNIFTPKGYVELNSTQSKFGGISGYFGDYGSLSTPHREDLNLPEDFTISGWINCSRTSGTQIILSKGRNSTTNYPSYEIILNGTSIQFTAYLADGAGSSIFNGVTFGTVDTGNWHYFEVVRYGSNWVGFLDGTSTSIGTSASNPFISTRNLVLGSDTVNTSTYNFKGYIDELRITKGVARDFVSFTSPTSPNQLIGYGDPIGMKYNGFHCRFLGSSFIDERGATISSGGSPTLSSTQSKFGGISGYFAGTPSYIYTPRASTYYDLEATDFTIECWIYRTRTGIREGICGTRPAIR